MLKIHEASRLVFYKLYPLLIKREKFASPPAIRSVFGIYWKDFCIDEKKIEEPAIKSKTNPRPYIQYTYIYLPYSKNNILIHFVRQSLSS